MWKNLIWDSALKLYTFCVTLLTQNVLFMKKDEISQARIAKNLQYLRRLKDFTQEQIADIYEISSTQYSNYEQGTRAVPIGVLLSASSYFNIALDVIAKSDLTKVDLKSLINVGSNRLLFPIIIQGTDKIESIEVVPVKASAGYLRGYSDPIFIESLPRISLPILGTKGTFRGFPIVGDSMLPLKDGSIVIGKFVEELSYLKEGKTCILVTVDGITYKRVYRNKHDDTILTLSSDNKIYTDYTVSLENILEIWEFAGAILLKEHDANERSIENLFPLVNGLTTHMTSMSQEIAKIKQSLNVI